jgi:hypothetical protein
MIYSNGVDDAILKRDYPMIARAAKVIRERMGFRGQIEIRPLRKNRAGEYWRVHDRIVLAPHITTKPWAYVIEIAVHETIHSFGIHHEDNFRTRGGARCHHGYDVLSHYVVELLEGRETWKNMKFLHEHIGAFSKKFLRQIARVEACVKTQRGIENALGGCVGLADLTDARVYRWQQMSAHDRAVQAAKMQVGRLKRLGYTIYDESRMVEQMARKLEARYR